MFTKLIVLIVILVAVWLGFKYVTRLQEIDRGQRKPAQRTMGERLRKATRNREKTGSDTDIVEDTEECPVCHAFISVDAQGSCSKPKCPY